MKLRPERKQPATGTDDRPGSGPRTRATLGLNHDTRRVGKTSSALTVVSPFGRPLESSGVRTRIIAGSGDVTCLDERTRVTTRRGNIDIRRLLNVH